MSDDGIELSDGGCILYPDFNGTIVRIDVWGNTMETRYPDSIGYDEWNKLFEGTEHYYTGEEE